MFFFKLALTAVRSLETHFLRSLLATLGVLIGVGSVVACMSILEGASGDIVKRFKSLGSNLLYVMPESARVEGRSVGSAQTLLPADIEVIMHELGDEVDSVAAEALGNATVKYFQRSEPATVVATNETYFDVNDFKAAKGRVLSKQEVSDELAQVVLLGAKLSEKLFGGGDAVGSTVKVGGSTYRVVGVMEKKGSLGFLNVDEAIFIPLKSGLKRFFNRKWLNRLTVQVKYPDKLTDVQKRLTQTLRKAHNIRIGEDADFRIFNQEEALSNVNQFMFIWKAVFYSIAGISLVVGGIGIMNIMLVSVTERTREIGVRMAVGARRGDILAQFLFEALIISMIGGIFGLLLGAMCSDLMNKMLRDFEFKTTVSTDVILTALITTTIVGVASGVYPAFKASRLDPVEALRHE
jgi:putative ABC transport system permease protein